MHFQKNISRTRGNIVSGIVCVLHELLHQTKFYKLSHILLCPFSKIDCSIPFAVDIFTDALPDDAAGAGNAAGMESRGKWEAGPRTEHFQKK